MEEAFYYNLNEASWYIGWMMGTGWIPFVYSGLAPEVQYHWDLMHEILLCAVSNNIDDSYITREFVKNYFEP